MEFVHPELAQHCKLHKSENGEECISINTETIESVIQTLCDDKIFVIPFFNDKYCKYLCKLYNTWSDIKQNDKDRNKMYYSLPNGLSNDGFIPQQFNYKIDKNIINLFDQLIHYLFIKNKDENKNKLIVSNYSYLIRYKINKDKSLKCHMDDSDITINICINDKDIKFDGNELYFYPNYAKADTPKLSSNEEKESDNTIDNEIIIYKHKPGYAVIHCGEIFHGVKELKYGQRYNLIHWTMIDVHQNNSWKSNFYKEYVEDLFSDNH